MDHNSNYTPKRPHGGYETRIKNHYVDIVRDESSINEVIDIDIMLPLPLIHS